MDPLSEEQIGKLLRLKKYEQPPPAYFENFLHEFHRRQRDELLREPVWRIALQRTPAFSPVKSVRFAVATAFALSTTFVYADETTPASGPAQSSEPSTASISREVKEIFEKSGKAVVKIRGTDEHGDLSGTGFFIDPTGMIYTAYSVGGDTDNLTVEFDGKTYPARLMMADLRSGIAILKADIATPALPIGKSESM